MAETTSHSNGQPDPELLNDIAIELAVDPSFVEKDWYAVQVVKALSRYTHDKIVPVFSGGTNLSKAYGLIKRFSEDIDFRTNLTEMPTTGERKQFRLSVIDIINGIENLKVIEDSIIKRDNRKFFSFDIEYPKTFEVGAALRPNLKLEMKIRPPQMETESKDIRSFVTQFTGADAEAQIQCIRPEEIAADKLSALIWRVLDRDRSAEHDDPAMIRHLHDLCALQSIIRANATAFTGIAQSSFGEDLARGEEAITQTLKQAAGAALEALRSDGEYKGEYTNFVTGMSYATEEERISFEAALEAFEEIIGLLTEQ
ncbi:MAG: nucleotidyl transferase AbiEii/AbiGii toxin family protein [Micavibrio sp.]|nr:nucleotidyl transferase AbiEii/AbiGii toxin family protein [Micavibrio sp.]